MCSSLVRKLPSPRGTGSETSPEPQDRVSLSRNPSPQNGLAEGQTRPSSHDTSRRHAPVYCLSSVLCKPLSVPLVSVELLVLRRVVLLLLVVVRWQAVAGAASHGRLPFGAKRAMAPGQPWACTAKLSKTQRLSQVRVLHVLVAAGTARASEALAGVLW